MEFNGEEKTIRALFREMKLADQRATPPFAREVKRKPAGTRARLSFGRLVFAVAMAWVILVSTFMLRRHFSTNQPRHESVKQLEKDGRNGQEQPSRRVEVSQEGNEARRPKNRVAKRPRSRNARLASTLRRRKDEAIFVSHWQSPTRAFLRSPGDELLKSVPQLQKSSLELKSFLNSGLN